MKLSDVKNTLTTVNDLRFQLPDGQFVRDHFHVTEIGKISKEFIDCGGRTRREKLVNFQLWEAGDFDHRLRPEKLSAIISLAEKALGLGDWEIEVEYQQGTIGKYGLHFNGHYFELNPKATNCLASETCGVSATKSKINLSDLQATSCCAPNSGCC
jgi:hypothetical protein